MARTQPSADDTKRRILDVSIALVAEQGVRGVSFREVARRAGVSHQTPYHVFGDHLGILRAIAAEGFAGLADAMRAAATGHDDPLAALQAAGIAYVRFARSHVGHFRVMFQHSLVGLHEDNSPEGVATYEALVQLARAVRRAGYAEGISEEALAHLAWSSAHGVSVLLLDGALSANMTGAASDDTVVRQVIGGLTRLLARPAPRT